MAQKNLVLRKKINDVLYDLMVKTVASQVYSDDGTKTVATMLSDLDTSVAAKAGSADLTALEAKFNNLVEGAPEAYDTLKEISEYISTHQNEYQALVNLSSSKVDKVDGKGLSTNDFTDELMEKLNDIYDKATTDEKFAAVESRITALEEAGGSIPANLTAADIAYTDGNGTDMTVKAALDQLLYVAITANMSMSVGSTQEAGASVSNVTVNWSYNKDSVVSQSINGVNLTDLTQRSYVEAGPITANKTFTLVASDGTKSVTKSTSISFQNKVYYGVSAVPETMDSAFVLGLTGTKFASSKSSVGTISVNAAAGQFIYYVQPATFTDPIFNIGGFDTEFELAATIDFTNASGYTTSYKVFKSGQAGLGSTSMTVK